MNHNVGGIDRILRIVVGLVLIALAATGTVGWWGWIGVVPLLTGLAGTCPAYKHEHLSHEVAQVSAAASTAVMAAPGDAGPWARRRPFLDLMQS